MPIFDKYRPQPEGETSREVEGVDPYVLRWLFESVEAEKCLGIKALSRLTLPLTQGRLPERFSDVKTFNTTIREEILRCKEEEKVKKKKRR